ncbi:MAG: hypothetical protein ABI542_08850 [Gemmatimonadota bacterium]
MKHIGIQRIFGACALSLAGCSNAATPQGGPGGGMMGGGYGRGWMGGYGWPWMLILLVVIAGLVGWIIARGRNRS